MSEAPDFTHDQLLDLLHYDPQTGIFTKKARSPDMFEDSPNRSKEHKCNNWNSCFAGKEAGSPNDLGYLRTAINNKLYYCHMLAWFYVYKEWPSVDVDHDDRNPRNNSITNLRLSTKSQNMGNAKKRKDNTTGWKGVIFAPWAKKYRAQIGNVGKNIHLGYFDCPAAASFAYQIAADKYFGDFSHSGFEDKKK